MTHLEFAKRFFWSFYIQTFHDVLVRVSRFFGPMVMLESDKIPIFDFKIVIFVRDHLLVSIYLNFVDHSLGTFDKIFFYVRGVLTHGR